MDIKELTTSVTKLTIPFGMVTTIIGGSAWLTTTRNAVEQNVREVHRLEVSLKEVTVDTNRLNERLGRMEEKIDFMVKMMERRKRGKDDNE